MRLFHITLREGMCLVFFAAVVLALLRQDPRIVVVGLYPAAILAALIGIYYGRGMSRVVAAGFITTLPIAGLLRASTYGLGGTERIACVVACGLVLAATIEAWRHGGKRGAFAGGYALCATSWLGFHAFYATRCEWRKYPPINVIILNHFYPLLYGSYSPNEQSYYRDNVLGTDEYYIFGGCLLGTFVGLLGGLLAYRLAAESSEIGA